MPRAQLGSLLRRIRGLVEPAADGAPSDRVLLERFVADRDEAAFAALVERHGPMILGICRRILGVSPDADDAFQATFCALAKLAPTTAWHDSLAGWLHVVARRVAHRARSRAHARRQHEHEAAAMHREEHTPGQPDPELREHIDDALDGLPEKYRAPLVLCYLHGQTNEEAARQLGWPKGTVQGRLARAREMLRKRLVRRGIALSAGTLPVLATQATADVPPALSQTTLRTAIQFAAGHAGVPGPVAALAEGVLHTMWLKKLQVAALIIACVGLLTGLGAWSRHWLTGVAAAPLPAAADVQGVHAVTPFAGGILDKDAKTIYVMNEAGGIDALDTAGKLLWSTPKGPTYWPIAVVGARLIARTRQADSGDFAIAVLDAAAQGKLLLKSDSMSFPIGGYGWFDSKVIGGARPVFQTTTTFAAKETVDKNDLVIDWQAQTRVQAERGDIAELPKGQQAAGIFRVNLQTGKVTKQDQKPVATLEAAAERQSFSVGDLVCTIEDTVVNNGQRLPVQQHQRTLKATKADKLVWQHPLKGYSIGFAP